MTEAQIRHDLIDPALRKAGHIDTWGRGTLKVYKACKEAGLPEPIFEEKDGGIQVTLFNEHPSERLRSAFWRKFGDHTKRYRQCSKLYTGLLRYFFELCVIGEYGCLRRSFGGLSEKIRKSF